MKRYLDTTNKRLIVAGVVMALLIGATAATASYLTRETLQAQQTEVQPRPMAKAHQASAPQQQVASAQPAKPSCDDSNVLGIVAGGAAGGIVGHQVGKGAGDPAATIGGALGGAYLGKQYIPLNNATCR